MAPVLVEAGREATTNSRATAFWWRLVDNLFRRLLLFLLPIVALTALGVVQAGNELALYRSSATLSASSNPFLPEQQIAGTAAQFFETPAAALSRVINEQLRTDSFMQRVAEQAGVLDAVDAGLIDLDVVRASVWAGANGDSILRVNAQWAEPATSQRLVTATIDEFRAYLNETLAADARDAELFFTEQLDIYTEARDEAVQALDEYVKTLPDLGPDEEYPLSVQIELQRRSDEVSAASTRINDAETQIDEARLTQTQQASEASRILEVIDAPQAPTAPESTLVKKIITVISFAVLGAIIALTALAVTTLLEQNVASAADLLGISGIALVATVPELAPAKRGRRRARLPDESTGSATP